MDRLSLKVLETSDAEAARERVWVVVAQRSDVDRVVGVCWMREEEKDSTVQERREVNIITSAGTGSMFRVRSCLERQDTYRDIIAIEVILEIWVRGTRRRRTERVSGGHRSEWFVKDREGTKGGERRGTADRNDEEIPQEG